MIVVKLMGGLGNQMFQYAVGRSLSSASKAELKLDVSWFESIPQNTTKRVYQLGVLNCIENFAKQEEIERLRGGDLRKWLSRWSGNARLGKKSHICERSARFDPSLFTYKDNVYLEGFWQSEKYFIGARELLLHEFSLKAEPDAANRELAQNIAATNAVSVHVRRGDYITNSNASDFHGACSLEYYHQAMNKIAGLVDNPFFFVFSDDPAWATTNIKSEYDIAYMMHNGPDNGVDDLFLMSRCRHHIIANSTFSWWGAWLCTNPDKIVVAPRNWFASSHLDTSDLLPDSWLRI